RPANRQRVAPRVPPPRAPAAGARGARVGHRALVAVVPVVPPLVLRATSGSADALQERGDVEAAAVLEREGHGRPRLAAPCDLRAGASGNTRPRRLSQTMRILFLSSIYPRAYAPVRGIYCQSLCRALAARHDVQVISPVAWTERLRHRRKF